jgi:acetyl esterase/lipase
VALRAQVLIYPMLDDRPYARLTPAETYPKTWNGATNAIGWGAYLVGRAGADDIPAYAAPARATVEQLRGLPPAYIDVGDVDLFRDEDIAYAQALMAAGVPCELNVTPGAFHGSELLSPGAASSRRIHRARFEALGRALDVNED